MRSARLPPSSFPMIAPGLDGNLDHGLNRESQSCAVVTQSDSVGLESPSHATSTPTELKRSVSGIEYNRLSSEAAVHHTLRRPRHTSSNSKRKIQISHPHSSFLC